MRTEPDNLCKALHTDKCIGNTLDSKEISGFHTNPMFILFVDETVQLREWEWFARGHVPGTGWPMSGAWLSLL